MIIVDECFLKSEITALRNYNDFYYIEKDNFAGI